MRKEKWKKWEKKRKEKRKRKIQDIEKKVRKWLKSENQKSFIKKKNKIEG